MSFWKVFLAPITLPIEVALSVAKVPFKVIDNLDSGKSLSDAAADSVSGAVNEMEKRVENTFDE